MQAYHHVLVALDLSDESELVIEKASSLASKYSAKVSLAHIIEPIALAYGGDIPIDLTDTQQVICDRATQRLYELARQAQVEPQNCHVIMGSIANELHQLAENIQADLMIVGNHGRHGLALLLGSTANSMIHKATCDTLTIKI